MGFEACADSGSELPILPKDWRWTLLREHVDPSRGICYGIVQPGRHDEHGVPMVNTGDVFDGSVAERVDFKVSRELHNKFRRSVLRGGELLVTLVGANFGRVAVAPPSYAGFNCSRAVGVVPALADVDYLMFALRSPIARHLMDTWANTTAQPTFNLKDLGNLPIPIPPAAERREISATLSALDGRIDLLRQTNTTLEAIAQALFKSWFVDFDPMHAKAEGREPEVMDAATAALFPSEFEESELGLIPKGWRSLSFGDAATLSKGTVNPLTTPDTEFEHYSLPAFDAQQMPVREAGNAIKSNKTPVPSGAVLVSKLNPHIPRIWPVGEVSANAVCSTEFLVWTPKAPASTVFVYCLASSRAFNSAMRQLVTGTSNSHQRVKPDQLKDIQVCAASDAALKAFATIASPLLRRMLDNRQQATTLASLRNTLLPRLISGKLHLSKATDAAEAALA